MIPARISQQEIARRCGVHVTTVSLALRDSPRLSLDTRKRIQELAKKLGYQPDPVLSALIAYRRDIKTAHHQGTLAWINNHTPPENLYRGTEFREYRDGALMRCEQLGYKLEEFHTATTTPAQLSRMLRARNIQGLLLPPQPNGFQSLNLDWENFSTVAFGFRVKHPEFHRACNAQFRSARLATRMIREKGYRRIGFVTVAGNEQSTDENFSSGYLAEQRHFPEAEKLPMLIFDEVAASRNGDYTERFLQEFAHWHRTHRPDAVLAHDHNIPVFLERLGIGSDTCGFASISVLEKSERFAGIYQNNLTIGRAAVDFLVGMIHRNERDIPPTPIDILVEGKWIDAPSLPGLPLPVQPQHAPAKIHEPSSSR